MTPSHWFGAAFLLYSVASLGWAVSFDDGMAGLLQILPLSLVFLIGVQTQDLHPVRVALGLAANVSAAVCLWQVFNGTVRPTGLFIGADVCAEFGAVALLGLMTLGWRWSPLIPGALVCALLPMSRGAILGFVLALPFLFGRRWLAWSTALVLVAGALAVDAAVNPDRLVSMAARLDIWSWTYANLVWFGWGIGNYISVFPVFEFAHSEPIHFAFELGIGSILLWAALLWPLSGPAAPVAKAMLVAVLVEGLVGFPLHHAATAFVACLCAGHLAGLWRSAGAAQCGSRNRHRSGGWPARLAARNLWPAAHLC